MAVTLQEILSIPEMSKARVVSDSSSLGGIVSWVHVVDVPEVAPWVHGGELLFITGIGLNGDEKSLYDFVNTIIHCNVAGLVVNLGPYISHIPESVVNLANSRRFPIFELPWEVKLVEVTRAICSFIVIKKFEDSFLDDLTDQLLNGQLPDPSLQKRATHFGHKLGKNYVCLIADLDNFRHYTERLKDEKQVQEIKQTVQQLALSTLTFNGQRPILSTKSDNFILLVPVNDDQDLHNLNQNAELLRQKVKAKIHDLTVSVAIGGFYQGLGQVHKSFTEAKQALAIAKVAFGQDRVTAFMDLGAYRLLLGLKNSEQLTQYYQDTVAVLVQFDQENQGALVRTLEVYLREGGNLCQAAKKLFIHRNTLKYRLQRIEEILDVDLTDGNVRLNCQLGLMIRYCLMLGKLHNNLRECSSERTLFPLGDSVNL